MVLTITQATSKGGFPPSRNFSVCTHVNFTRVNKIEIMCGRLRIKVEVEPRSTFTFTRSLPYTSPVLAPLYLCHATPGECPSLPALCDRERGARTGLSIHCLFFIYARKFYVRSHGKIMRQWKSILRSKIRRDWYTIYYSGTFITCDFLGYPRSLRVQPSLIAPSRNSWEEWGYAAVFRTGIRRLVPAWANDKRWPLAYCVVDLLQVNLS